MKIMSIIGRGALVALMATAVHAEDPHTSEEMVELAKSIPGSFTCAREFGGRTRTLHLFAVEPRDDNQNRGEPYPTRSAAFYRDLISNRAASCVIGLERDGSDVMGYVMESNRRICENLCGMFVTSDPVNMSALKRDFQ